MGWQDLNLGNIGAAGMMLAAYNQGQNAFDQTAQTLETQGQALQDKYLGGMDFKPFTVTTGTGSKTGYDASGNVTMQLSPEEQALQNQMFAGAAQQYGLATADPTQATQDYYNQMMAASNPEMQRQRLALENRLAAQGRLGVGTAMYGGTPEQLAMEKAAQEQMAKNYLAAREAANQERKAAGNLANSMFSAAYAPQTQLGNMYGLGLQGAELQQQANQAYGKAALETGMSILDAILKNRQASANLTGNFLTGLGSSMQQQINPITGKPIANTGLFGTTTLGDVGGWLSDGWNWLTGNASTAATYGTNPYSQQTAMLAAQDAGF